jgi:uncharacterized SAM-binding protein YcdF (DUF218 family)
MSDRVVAVLGYSHRAGGTLHPVCAHRLAHAQRLASSARTVILSGEADLMRAAWAGPDVVLVCDPDARSTADNARNVAAAARELGAQELVVVTSRWHQARAGILLRAALRGSGIRLSIETTSGPRPLLLLARELGCFVLLPFQLAQVKWVVPDRAPGTTQLLFATWRTARRRLT